MYTIRNTCLICNFDNNLVDILDSSLNIPTFGSTVSTGIPSDSDIYIPYNISYCSRCDFYQNKYLGLPKNVYMHSHNSQVISNVWKNHYSKFANFILANYDSSTRLLECGPGSFYLTKLLLTHISPNNYYAIEPNICVDISYTKINIINSYLEDIPDELYKKSTLIMSHSFEHIYDPNSILDKHIDNIIISIPDYSSYVEDNIFNFLNIEHTFYYNHTNLLDLFKKHGYSLKDYYNYNRHSIFLSFSKNIATLTPIYLPLDIVTNKNNIILPIFLDNIRKVCDQINTIIVNDSNYRYALFPCSLMIQMLAIFGLKLDRIYYCFDNSKDKHCNRLYGTNLTCVSLDLVKKLGLTIIIIKTAYIDEIITQLKDNKVNYILI